ncbi:hypothetical protein DNTS_020681, partial [Danionella cerebrum]
MLSKPFDFAATKDSKESSAVYERRLQSLLEHFRGTIAEGGRGVNSLRTFGFDLDANEICAEFHCITNINLRNQFYSGLDIHTPRLLNLIRQKAARTGKFSETQRAMMNLYDQHIVESPEPEISNTAVSVLTIINENSSSPMHFSPVSAAVIVEDQIV